MAVDRRIGQRREWPRRRLATATARRHCSQRQAATAGASRQNGWSRRRRLQLQCWCRVHYHDACEAGCGGCDAAPASLAASRNAIDSADRRKTIVRTRPPIGLRPRSVYVGVGQTSRRRNRTACVAGGAAGDRRVNCRASDANAGRCSDQFPRPVMDESSCGPATRNSRRSCSACRFSISAASSLPRLVCRHSDCGKNRPPTSSSLKKITDRCFRIV